MITMLLSTALGGSLLANAFLAYLLRKKPKQNPQPDANAQEVLAELLAGPAVFRIEAIDRGSLIQWKGFGK